MKSQIGIVLLCLGSQLSAIAAPLNSIWRVNAQCQNSFSFSGGQSFYSTGQFELTAKSAVQKLAKELELLDAERAVGVRSTFDASACGVSINTEYGNGSHLIHCHNTRNKVGDTNRLQVVFFDEQGNRIAENQSVYLQDSNGLQIGMKYKIERNPYCADCSGWEGTLLLSLEQSGKKSSAKYSEFGENCGFVVKFRSQDDN
jgi:hypothetical protein